MTKYLVTFNDIFNDVDLYGFKIMTEKEVESFENLASTITWDFNYPLNDSKIEFIDGDDLLSRLEFKEITNEEFKALKKVFNSDFGVFVDYEFLESIVEGEEPSDDEGEDEDEIYDYDNEDEDEDEDY